MLGGMKVNYNEMYESPSMMTLRLDAASGRRRGGYEAVASEDV